jgi:GAF domain-containing protein
VANPELLLQVLSDFARTLSGRYSIADVLAQLTENVTAVLDVTGAGVSILDEENQLRFVTASSDALIAAEEQQEHLQQGPCIDAAQLGDVVMSTNLGEEVRWPGLLPVLRSAPFRAVVAIPLVSEDRSLGSLNIYDERIRHWSEGDVRAARVLADMTVGYVINASQLEQAERTREQLQEALESRVVIEQAKGMLANANGIPIDEAFGRLRRHARNSRRPLREVATAVVESGLEIAGGGSGHRTAWPDLDD